MRLGTICLLAQAVLPTACPLLGEVLTNCADIAALPQSAPTNFTHTQTACVVGRVSSMHDPTQNNFFLFDDTGFIPVTASSNSALSAGSIYRITGLIMSYKYGENTLLATTSELIRKADPPAPIKADFQRILEGQLDGQGVVFSGLVIDAFPDEVDPLYVWMLVRQHGVTIPLAAHCPTNRRESCQRFIGKEISGAGFCTPPVGRRRFGVSVVNVKSLEDIMIAPDDADIFSAPELDPLHPGKSLSRCCIEGIVLAIWGNHQAFVTLGIPKIEVRIREDVGLPAVGTHIRVSGFLEKDSFFPRLIQASWKPVSTGASHPPPNRTLSPREILAAKPGGPVIEPHYHGDLIRLTGKLRNRPVRLANETVFHLESDGYLIPVNASALSADELLGLSPGMTLTVIGLCLMEYDETRSIAGFPRLKGFSLVVRDDNDIRVLARPPWWTPARLLAVIGSLIGLVVAALVWGWWLNRLVERRSRELMREQIAHRNAESRREDRTRLAVELHDSLSQNLAAVAFQISSAKSAQNVDPSRAAQRLGTAEKMLDSCRSELRNCLGDLRSNALEQRDFEQAIRMTVNQVRCDAEVRISFPVARTRLSDSAAHAILMILRELVSNAVRHGQARQVDIRGELTGERLSFCVSDDGLGFNVDKRPGIREGHFGVEGIRQRVKRLNGTFALESTPGAGTKAALTIPIVACAS